MKKLIFTLCILLVCNTTSAQIVAEKDRDTRYLSAWSKMREIANIYYFSIVKHFESDKEHLWISIATFGSYLDDATLYVDEAAYTLPEIVSASRYERIDYPEPRIMPRLIRQNFSADKTLLAAITNAKEVSIIIHKRTGYEVKHKLNEKVLAEWKEIISSKLSEFDTYTKK